jgi:hypothetical protein
VVANDREGLAFGSPPVGQPKIVSSPFELGPIAEPPEDLATHQDLTRTGKLLDYTKPIDDGPGEHLEDLDIWISHQESAGETRGHYQLYGHVGLGLSFRGRRHRSENSLLAGKPASNGVTSETDDAAAVVMNNANGHFKQGSELFTQTLGP